MIKFSSIWAHVEGFFAKALPTATQVAADAEPIVDLAIPGIATLYNAGVTAAIKAEAAAERAGSTGDSTISQQAAVTAAALPYLTAYAEQLGAPAPAINDVNKWAATLLQSLTLWAKIHASVPAAQATTHTE